MKRDQHNPGSSQKGRATRKMKNWREFPRSHAANPARCAPRRANAQRDGKCRGACMCTQHFAGVQRNNPRRLQQDATHCNNQKKHADAPRRYLFPCRELASPRIQVIDLMLQTIPRHSAERPNNR
jgi:hypothetical protein